MNKFYLIFASALTLLLLPNCAKKENKSASADMSAACYYQQTQSGTASSSCNGSGYSGVNGFGAASYSYSSYGGGSINCGGGSAAPVYSALRGAGCVVASYISQSGTPAIYSLNQSTGVFTLNTSSYSYGNGTQVYRSCNDSDDKCPSGLSCRSPFGSMASSSLGICYR